MDPFIFNNKVYPCTIVSDRYCGCYSDASWTAWGCDAHEVPTAIDSGDCGCAAFWDTYDGMVGKGNTPQEAYNDLKRQVIMQDKKKKR